MFGNIGDIGAQMAKLVEDNYKLQRRAEMAEANLEFAHQHIAALTARVAELERQLEVMTLVAFTDTKN